MRTAQAVPVDAAQRRAALDPHRSFLVQAPAGSGKTELLIQRYLRLLGVVREPEEILAITFTRKAAAEMRERVLAALNRARAREEPAEAHLRLAYELAVDVVARDEQLGWNLAQQPERLRVSTIDSLNAWLAGRAPLSSGGAAQLAVSEAPEELYTEAARRLLDLIEEPGEQAQQLRCLLAHYDNRAELLVAQVAEMLARRDQWLRHTGPGMAGDAQRAGLEASLALLVQQALSAAAERLPVTCREELAGLLATAAGVLTARGDDSGSAWCAREDFPRPVAAELPRWRFLANRLLTAGGQWRKPSGINVTQGFPREDKEAKQAMQALLEQLSADELLRASLDVVRQLPEPRYSDSQWAVLRSLLALLPWAAALLQEVFQRRGRVDFSEVAMEALRSLDHADTPSELGLILDHRLSHLLLDEYQDTSRSQYDLLCRLTAGWEPGDGRSVFLVGDPMQSIYRFREAEVGIYLQTRSAGLGGLPLEFLRLQTNFRADPALVTWFNELFPRVLPAADDPETGAVSYAPSLAFRPGEDGAGVSWHLHAYGDRDGEARDVAEIVRRSLQARPAETIGILVRSRAHAARIAPRLRREGLRFAAPDLEQLSEQPVAQDLLALSRAFLHRGDRIAWLAVLRGPGCGLNLRDLHALASADFEASVWELLQDNASQARLSADGRERVGRLVKALGPWLAHRGPLRFRDCVEGAWLQLGGPAALASDDELEVALQFFEFLERQERSQAALDPVALATAADQQPVHSHAANAQVQLMTMHKAKGLEFDTVILPGLGYGTGSSSKPLMLWTELTGESRPQLVLAPNAAKSADKDPIFELLWAFERRREALETNRLLYVAVTRARQRLHLCAALQADKEGRPVARGDSLLAPLWPLVADHARLPPELQLPQRRSDGEREPRWSQPALRRLPRDWQAPVELQPPASVETVETVEYAWASPVARHVGQVVHRWLQAIAGRGLEHFTAERLEACRPAFARMLAQLGTPAQELAGAVDRVAEALQACVEDPRGRWLLSGEHPESETELAVSIAGDDGYRLQRIDRCLVDVDGTRWIVDYKTSPHEGADLAAFLASEAERYGSQLLRYRQALDRLRAMPTRTALYYPLLRAWLEIDAAGNPVTEPAVNH